MEQKKSYCPPEVDVTTFDAIDLIVTSDGAREMSDEPDYVL